MTPLKATHGFMPANYLWQLTRYCNRNTQSRRTLTTTTTATRHGRQNRASSASYHLVLRAGADEIPPAQVDLLETVHLKHVLETRRQRPHEQKTKSIKKTLYKYVPMKSWANGWEQQENISRDFLRQTSCNFSNYTTPRLMAEAGAMRRGATGEPPASASRTQSTIERARHSHDGGLSLKLRRQSVG